MKTWWEICPICQGCEDAEDCDEPCAMAMVFLSEQLKND